ncbi:hypothetical protein J1614_007624 [Plenodomus biglobosus]|nr:hypothetical protein J1614_007624 [Plenodomus biglobosus]
MAINYGRVQCRSCYRVLALASATGLAPEDSNAQGCDTCQQFGAYYDAVQTVDREWAELETKRDSLKARQIARLNHMQIHMKFDNWLIEIEAGTEHEEPQTQGCADHIMKKEQSAQSEDQQQHQGTKRAFSASPPSRHTADHTLSQGPPDNQAREEQCVSLSLRPSPKGLRRTTSLPHRKRLKFSDTVEFRDNYRDSSEYMRTDDKYVRGRYAPPDDSDYLDTSGSAQTFLKFTGVRRVKGAWVEVMEADTAGKRKGGQAVVEGTSNEAVMLGRPACDVPHKIDDNETAPSDQRALRLARRTRNASSASVGQHKSNARSAKNNLYRKANQTSLLSASDTVDSTSGAVAIKRFAPQVDTENPGITNKVVVREVGSITREGLAPQDDVAPERCTGAVTDEQTIEIPKSFGSPSEGYRSLIVPHKSGTSNGYASVKTSGQHTTLGAKAAQHTFARQTLGDEAHRVQTELLLRVGEVPTPLRVRHSVLLPDYTDATAGQPEQQDASQSECRLKDLNLAAEKGKNDQKEVDAMGDNVSGSRQKRVLDDTESTADPYSPPATILHHSTMCSPTKALEAAVGEQAIGPPATPAARNPHAHDPSLQEPAAIASHPHYPPA